MSCSRALVMGMRWSDPCSFCDRWCGHSGGLLGAQCQFHEQAILELERQVSVVDLLETRVKELEQFSDIVKGVAAGGGRTWQEVG